MNDAQLEKVLTQHREKSVRISFFIRRSFIFLRTIVFARVVRVCVCVCRGWRCPSSSRVVESFCGLLLIKWRREKKRGLLLSFCGLPSNGAMGEQNERSLLPSCRSIDMGLRLLYLAYR
jgi:hypothetical protein